MSITPELQQIYSGSNVNRPLETLEFSHPNWGAPIRIVNDIVNWTFVLETGEQVTFVAIPFTLKLPDRNTAGAEDLQIVICNIGREIMDPIEAASRNPETSITCLFRMYLDIQNSAPQMNPPLRLQINNIAATTINVTATATRFDVLNRPFPTELYQITNFPGLRR